MSQIKYLIPLLCLIASGTALKCYKNEDSFSGSRTLAAASSLQTENCLMNNFTCIAASFEFTLRRDDQSIALTMVKQGCVPNAPGSECEIIGQSIQQGLRLTNNNNNIHLTGNKCFSCNSDLCNDFYNPKSVSKAVQVWSTLSLLLGALGLVKFLC